MVCALCQSIERLSPERRAEDAAAAASAPGLCERCGRPLEGETLERLTAKVAQLARFGLTGRPPLFRRRA
jgi:hypothetical protein